MSKSASFKHQVSKVKIDNQQPQFSKGTLRNMFLPTKRRWESWGIGVSIALQDFHKKKFVIRRLDLYFSASLVQLD